MCIALEDMVLIELFRCLDFTLLPVKNVSVAIDFIAGGAPNRSLRCNAAKTPLLQKPQIAIECKA
jgi:hypothetical protein